MYLPACALSSSIQSTVTCCVILSCCPLPWSRRQIPSVYKIVYCNTSANNRKYYDFLEWLYISVCLHFSIFFFRVLCIIHFFRTSTTDYSTVMVSPTLRLFTLRVSRRVIGFTFSGILSASKNVQYTAGERVWNTYNTIQCYLTLTLRPHQLTHLSPYTHIYAFHFTN